MSVEDVTTRMPVQNALCVAAMIGESNKQSFVVVKRSVLCEVTISSTNPFCSLGRYYAPYDHLIHIRLEYVISFNIQIFV